MRKATKKRPVRQARCATGTFFIKQHRNGKYSISLTAFDFTHRNPQAVQAQIAMLQSLLLDLHQGRDCLDVGRVFVDTSFAKQTAETKKKLFEVRQ